MRKNELRYTKEEILQMQKMGWEIVNYELDKTESLCELLKSECAYAYCHHDKDTDKKPHVHLLLVFSFEKSGQSIFDMCETMFEQNVRIDPISNLQRAYDYLIHKNDKDKYQYPRCERITNNARIFKGMGSTVKSTVKKDKKPSFDEMIDDIIDGKMSTLELARKYGRDYVKNMARYNDFRRAVVCENRIDLQFVDDIEIRAERIIKSTGEVIRGGEQIDPKYLNSAVFQCALQIAQEIYESGKKHRADIQNSSIAKKSQEILDNVKII